MNRPASNLNDLLIAASARAASTNVWKSKTMAHTTAIEPSDDDFFDSYTNVAVIF
jgi:hypothetical protein